MCLEAGQSGRSAIFVTGCSRKSNHRQMSEFWFKPPNVLQDFIAVHSIEHDFFQDPDRQIDPQKFFTPSDSQGPVERNALRRGSFWQDS